MDKAAAQDAKTPSHRGELQMEDRVGVTERMKGIGLRNVRDFMPDQHREFFAQLPFIVLGTVDQAGEAWATFHVGYPGFIDSPHSRALRLRTVPDPADPASEGFT